MNTVESVLLALSLAACSRAEPEAATDLSSPDADWVRLGYDLGSTYFNRAERKVSRATAATLEWAWELDAGGQVTGTPVISGGRVYLASADLIAVDVETGRELWRAPGVGGTSSPTLDGGVLFLHDARGVLRAFRAEDGMQLWEHVTDDHPTVLGTSSPIVAGDLVLVGGSSGEESIILPGDTATFRGFVLAVRKSDGARVWKKHTVEAPHSGAAVWSTVSVDPVAKRVFASTGNNYTGEPSDTSDAFLALPLDTGSDFLWKRQIFEGDVFTVYVDNGNPDGDFGANPVLYELGGRRLVAGGSKVGDVWVLDRTTGEVLAQRNLGRSNAFKGGVFVSGAWDGRSLLFAVNDAADPVDGSAAPPGAVLFALDPLDLAVRWQREVGPVVYSPITVAGGAGFFGNDTVLEAFDTATGEKLAEFPAAGTIATAPAISNGHVVFGSGMTYVQATGGSKYHALRVR